MKAARQPIFQAFLDKAATGPKVLLTCPCNDSPSVDLQAVKQADVSTFVLFNPCSIFVTFSYNFIFVKQEMSHPLPRVVKWIYTWYPLRVTRTVQSTGTAFDSLCLVAKLVAMIVQREPNILQQQCPSSTASGISKTDGFSRPIIPKIWNFAALTSICFTLRVDDENGTWNTVEILHLYE